MTKAQQKFNSIV